MLVLGESPYSLVWYTANVFESSLCFFLQFHLLSSLFVVLEALVLPQGFKHIGLNIWNVSFILSTSTSFPWLICTGLWSLSSGVTSLGSRHLNALLFSMGSLFLLYALMVPYGYSTMPLITIFRNLLFAYLYPFIRPNSNSRACCLLYCSIPGKNKVFSTKIYWIYISIIYKQLVIRVLYI